jgi:hypothetical protein
LHAKTLVTTTGPDATRPAASRPELANFWLT